MPRHILSVAEVEQVLNACIDGDETTNPLGLRDRAMLETLYGTGMRGAEMTGLLADDLDLNRGSVFVRQCKRAKDRVVPAGERACRWVGLPVPGAAGSGGRGRGRHALPGQAR